VVPEQVPAGRTLGAGTHPAAAGAGPAGAADRAASGAPPSEEDDWRSDAMVRLFDHYGRYGITGNPNVLGWLLGRPPTSFEEYVRRSLAGS